MPPEFGLRRRPVSSPTLAGHQPVPAMEAIYGDVAALFGRPEGVAEAAIDVLLCAVLFGWPS